MHMHKFLYATYQHGRAIEHQNATDQQQNDAEHQRGSYTLVMLLATHAWFQMHAQK